MDLETRVAIVTAGSSFYLVRWCGLGSLVTFPPAKESLEVSPEWLAASVPARLHPSAKRPIVEIRLKAFAPATPAKLETPTEAHADPPETDNET